VRSRFTVLGFALALVSACTGGSVHVVVPTGWQTIQYHHAAFAVPASWPVTHPDAYAWWCETYRQSGVYLAPSDEADGGYSCPASPPDAALDLVHVWTKTREQGTRTTINGEAAWRSGTGTVRVSFPGLGVELVFDGHAAGIANEVLATVRRS
jgi:hypothetical protein